MPFVESILSSAVFFFKYLQFNFRHTTKVDQTCKIRALTHCSLLALVLEMNLRLIIACVLYTQLEQL